jgi:long-chain acyl-CoA synthetase
MDFPFSTLPGLVQYAGKTHRNPAALAHRVNGAWVTLSSEEVLAQVRRAGAGLVAWGLRPGDHVGIAAPPSPYWLMADWASLGAGAITVPMFPNAAPENLAHQIGETGMRVLFVDTEAQRRALEPLCGSIERVIVLRPEADGEGDTWEALMSEGGEQDDQWAQEWERRGEAVSPVDTATIIYTSGSTGLPKGVELTHGNIVSQVQGARRLFPLDPEGDRALSFLPLAHIFERMVSCYYVASGVGVWIAADPKKAGEDAREVHPTIITLVPRFL